MKTLYFTGGGTAGHIIPNLVLIEHLKTKGWQCGYIGSRKGLEFNLVKPYNIPFFSIYSGRLRRYFSLKTFFAPLGVFLGFLQSLFILLRKKPNAVLSKGGYVTLPVVVAAWVCRIPVIGHESDLSLGLANRLAFPFLRTLCVSFEKTRDSLSKKSKVVVTGMPIRPLLKEGDPSRGLKKAGFSPLPAKPVLLVLGGGLGSVRLNALLKQTYSHLCATFNIIHLMGPGRLDPDLKGLPGYCTVEAAYGELFADWFACADLVISRAGASSVYELLYFKKPHLLIPLSGQASRGDQIENANYTASLGLSQVLLEETLTAETFLTAIEDLKNHQAQYRKALESYAVADGTFAILKVIEAQIKDPLVGK